MIQVAAVPGMRRPSDSEGITTVTTIPPPPLGARENPMARLGSEPRDVAVAVAALGRAFLDSVNWFGQLADERWETRQLAALIALANEPSIRGGVRAILDEAERIATA